MSKKLIVLDLDHTLIHTMERKFGDEEYDFSFEIDNEIYYTIKRPNLDVFLYYVFENFRVGFWSAAQPVYILKILDNILEDYQKPEFIMTYYDCDIRYDQSNMKYVIKDIGRIYNTPELNISKNDIRIIDDSSETYELNEENAIEIERFYRSMVNDDRELYRVITVCEKFRLSK